MTFEWSISVLTNKKQGVNMKKGFTMIELIFVIVILGILAAVAVPKLAATRDDAKIASIKTDIGTLVNAVPSWYQGQKEASILKAASIDTNTWKQNGSKADFTYSIDSTPCVQIKVVDLNDSNTSNISVVSGHDPMDEPSLSTAFTATPTLQIVKGASTDSVCADIWTRITEQNISMGGKKVQW